jgi:hypothetical protein
VARHFAKRTGVLELCERRGIEGLLREARSVKMAAGISLSLAYAVMFEKAEPQIGDSRDQQHATMAAARAEIFVSNDRRLNRLIGRVPVDGFASVSLSEVLASVSHV